jgi:hypothetical protein
VCVRERERESEKRTQREAFARISYNEVSFTCLFIKYNKLLQAK